MTDKPQNGHFDSPGKSAWLTPQEAATELNISLRAAYRLIERGTLVSDGARHGQKVSRESVEAARLRLFAEDVANNDFDRQETKQNAKPGYTESRASVLALLSIREERDAALSKADKTQERVEELLELRRQDALELGKLQERVAQLEVRLQEARQPVPAAPVAPIVPQEVVAPTPAPKPPVESPALASIPKKRGLFGWLKLNL